MSPAKAIFQFATRRRLAGLLACAALLFFAFGGAVTHHHVRGPDKACHICQALHLPALAVAGPNLTSAPEIVARYSSLPLHVAPSDSFALHRASRAPPTA